MSYFNDSRNAAIVFQNSNSAAAAIVAAIVAHPQSDPDADILTLFDTIHVGIFNRTVDGIEAFIAEQALKAQLGATPVDGYPQSSAPQNPTYSQDTTPVSGPPVPPAQEKRCPTCGGQMWDKTKDKRNPRAPDYKCRDKGCEGVIWPPKGR